jgi:hypothetical protein
MRALVPEQKHHAALDNTLVGECAHAEGKAEIRRVLVQHLSAEGEEKMGESRGHES